MEHYESPLPIEDKSHNSPVEASTKVATTTHSQFMQGYDYLSRLKSLCSSPCHHAPKKANSTRKTTTMTRISNISFISILIYVSNRNTQLSCLSDGIISSTSFPPIVIGNNLCCIAYHKLIPVKETPRIIMF